jgi:hypothetical protein
MNLNHYLFEHSYLIGLDYDPISCSLKLFIDAKITFEHPKANKINENATFVDIEVLFEGVTYFRILTNPLLQNNPNDDYGSIEHFYLKNSNEVSQGFAVKKIGNTQKLSLELSDGLVYSVLSNSNEIKFLNLISEMLSFEIGFEKMIIRENG